IDHLQAQLDKLRRMNFGSRSEKVSRRIAQMEADLKQLQKESDIGPDCESVNNKLTVTSKATVQPVALMRLNVFVPSSRPAKGTR
ncbi:transposase domain-containing protein, partial [Citrobacter freundii]